MKSIRTLIAALTLLGTVSALQAADTGVPASYPLKTCPVSKENLGEMGKPVKVTGPDGTDVYLCCKSCLKDFNKEPEKFTKVVKEAAAKKS